jgi:predicted AAA+ superfamily ATPase
MLSRFFNNLDKKLSPNKVLIIYGPRRVGKTTLVKSFLASTTLNYRFDSGDNINVQHILSSSDFRLIKEYAEGKELVVIDEAQNIPHVGKGLKIIVDEIPGIKVLVTGSSSFDLSNKIGEPLVGRQKTIKLFPISLLELSKDYNRSQIKDQLADYLIYGFYPEVITAKTKNEKVEYLGEMVNSFLLKDILALGNLKSSRVLFDLLRLLAFQVGNEVSLNELSNQLKIDVKTVARYIDLLEKTFILISLGGYSKNLRNEVVSKKKYYFVDIGIRNAVINNFNPLEARNDIGALWENFIFIERLKTKSYQEIHGNDFFWRTYSKNEIDLIEERDGKLFGYEFKWRETKYKVPAEFKEAYPEGSVELINSDNFLDFVL